MSQLPHQAYNHWAAHGDYKPDIAQVSITHKCTCMS